MEAQLQHGQKRDDPMTHLDDESGILRGNESRRQVNYDVCNLLCACTQPHAQHQSARYTQHPGAWRHHFALALRLAEALLVIHH